MFSRKRIFTDRGSKDSRSSTRLSSSNLCCVSPCVNDSGKRLNGLPNLLPCKPSTDVGRMQHLPSKCNATHLETSYAGDAIPHEHRKICQIRNLGCNRIPQSLTAPQVSVVLEQLEQQRFTRQGRVCNSAEH